MSVGDLSIACSLLQFLSANVLKFLLYKFFPLAYLESTQEGYCIEAIIKAIIPRFLSPYVCHLQIVHLFHCVREKDVYICCGTHVEVKGQFVDVSSLLLLCGP